MRISNSLVRRALLLLLLPLLAALLAPVAAAPAATPAPVRHVWVLVLENENADTSFGASSAAPYLAHTLPAEGAFVPNYYGTGHESLDNYVAMISGQGPNTQTQSDCQVYTEMTPGVIGPDGQALGSGCIYPASVPTLAGQLDAAGHSWRGYMEDMGNDPTRESATCGRPVPDMQDHTQTATATDHYAARHDPFVYFHSIVDDAPLCNADVVPLTRLPADLSSADSTPSFSFITPNLCDDGHDATCVGGGPGGLTAVDGFLRTWVPRITASPAFRADGLLAIIFDEASSDDSSCCSEPMSPNTPSNGLGGSGGGRTGAVLLSPFIAPGTVTQTAYDHYSLLRSVEDIFGLPHLGYAGVAGLDPFGADVFTAAAHPSAAPFPPSPAPAAPAARGPSCGGGQRLLATVRIHARRLTLRVRRAAALTVTVLPRHGQRRVLHRRLQCRAVLSVRLGRGHGRVRILARLLGGHRAQRLTRRY